MDITVNNRLAVINTKLLRDYAAVDPRLRLLVLLVKHWSVCLDRLWGRGGGVRAAVACAEDTCLVERLVMPLLVD